MTEDSPGAAARAWHHVSTEEALRGLDSAPGGLDPAEAARRLARHGPNRLPAAKRRGALLSFLAQFHNILIYVLLGSALITAVLDHLVDTAVILAVVIGNAVIGFLQEGKAERAMDAIREMLAPHAAVLRGGERHTVPAQDLVPGDIVLLEAGDRVPADLRLLSLHGLQVQEAILTGESVPVDKSADPVAAGAPLGDRSGMAFSGTLVTAGQGRGVVTATGAATEIGRISGLLSGVETLTTPLVAQMNVFARWLTALILLLAGLLLAYGYYVMGYDFAELFMIVVGMSVSVIPEGLPAVLTITLAIGVQQMARRNAIIRRLPAIEAIGAVSVICTDKTGTLTRNEMAVARALVADHGFEIGGVGYAPQGDILPQGHEAEASAHEGLRTLARAAALCNDAELRERDGVWTAEGDPMEDALLAFAAKAGCERRALQAVWPRTDAIPFDARHRFMATLNHDHEGRAFIFVKGAPETLLAMCDSEQDAEGRARPLDAERWRGAGQDIAAQGQRVLAFAAKPVKAERTVLEFADVQAGLCLLGLVGLIDPPRPEAVRAVAECRTAGIRVKMITGDHASTAAAIGRQVGLERGDRVLTGADLDGMDDGELGAAVLDVDIFARTSPEHKLRLVKALQSHGLSVAMTGDGVNDAPALKRADAGIAMGRKGSEAAKEASVLVLADDNFASIAAAVREGRTVYDNIRKVISWTLPTDAGEALVLVIALLFGMMPMPITAIQILWVNLITSVALGLALAFEPPEENTMRRPPRPRGAPLLDGVLVWHIVFVSALFLSGSLAVYGYALDRGYSAELVSTLVLNTLVVMEIFHLFFIRNIHGTSLTWRAVRGTRAVWLSVLVTVAAQFAITYVPFLQAVFGTEAVSLRDGALVVGVGVALFAIVEIEKQMRLRLGSMRAP